MLFFSSSALASLSHSSQVEFDVKLFIKSFELDSYLATHRSNSTIFSIIQQTVVKYELHVVNELLQRVVMVSVQALLDSAEIDWILHHFVVVRDAQLLWVDWLMEDTCVVQPPELAQQSLGHLIPGIEMYARLFRQHGQEENGLTLAMQRAIAKEKVAPREDRTWGQRYKSLPNEHDLRSRDVFKAKMTRLKERECMYEHWGPRWRTFVTKSDGGKHGRSHEDPVGDDTGDVLRDTERGDELADALSVCRLARAKHECDIQ